MIPQTRLRSATLALASTLALLSSPTTPDARAQGAGRFQPLDIVASLQDRAILDTNDDGKGNAAGAVQGVEGRVGENQIDADESRYCLLFEFTDAEAAALRDRPAAKVTFNIFLVGKLNARDLAVNLVSFPIRGGRGTLFDAPDFHSEGKTVRALAVTDATPGAQFVSLDVTRHVRSAITNGTRLLALRFELADYTVSARRDGIVNRFIFASADSSNPPFLRIER